MRCNISATAEATLHRIGWFYPCKAVRALPRKQKQGLSALLETFQEMHSQLIKLIFRRTDRKGDKVFARQGKATNENVLLLKRIGQVILSESEVADAYGVLNDLQCASREQLAQQEH